MIYIYTASVDGFNINYPLILTPEEYEKLVLKETMRKYFQDKQNAVDGKRAGSEEARKNLLPRFYVNNKLTNINNIGTEKITDLTRDEKNILVN